MTSRQSQAAMKIVVLGATGTTGALVLDEALAAGHEAVVPFANVAKVLVSLAANQNQPRQRLLVTTPGGWR